MHCQHPGKILLQQYLEPRKISQNGLARAIKVPPRRINEIIHQKRGITADTAVRLAIYFGGSAVYWMHLQSEYEIEKVKKHINIQLSTLTTPAVATDTSPTNINRKTKPSRPGSAKNRIMR